MQIGRIFFRKTNKKTNRSITKGDTGKWNLWNNLERVYTNATFLKNNLAIRVKIFIKV